MSRRLNSNVSEIVLYAPNVHTGGGLILLQALLTAWMSTRPLRAFLDIRAIEHLTLPDSIKVTWVAPSVIDRLHAEFSLRKLTYRSNTILLCFHGLPPLFRAYGRVLVFVQNRLLIENIDISLYPLRIRTRLAMERLWFRAFRNQCNHYIVQTHSMKTSLRKRVGENIPISLLNFMPAENVTSDQLAEVHVRKYDFVYVASGEAHKNHLLLLNAWQMLADDGLSPSLALTIDPDLYPDISAAILKSQNHTLVNITNLGHVPPATVSMLYKSSGALIFPSKVESLGLPLIEANQLGLPIIAAELDYVRDIVIPVETFDPDSAVSIARAVRRFLGISTPPASICTAEQFLEMAFK